MAHVEHTFVGIPQELERFRMAGDWRLYLQALSKPGARIAYVADVLNVHRRHASSITHKPSADRHVDEIVMCHESRQMAIPTVKFYLHATDTLRATSTRSAEAEIFIEGGQTGAKTRDELRLIRVTYPLD